MQTTNVKGMLDLGALLVLATVPLLAHHGTAVSTRIRQSFST